MQWTTKIRGHLAILVFGTALIFGGCEGSEPREQADDTVKELSGQKQVEQMDRMKKQLDAINKKHLDQLKQFDESDDN